MTHPAIALPIKLPSQTAWQQQRQAEGLRVSAMAINLLLTQYNVEQVLLFGSLTQTQKVRQTSDIDLAVWGLSDQNYYQALNDLQDLSQTFSFDLVQFETAQPALQHKILSTGLSRENLLQLSNHQSETMANSQYVLLIAQIKQELAEINTVVENNQRILQKYRATQDEDYLGAIALNLHSFYSGVERIFKQIAQTIDHSVPDTADWHRQLLRQMTINIENLRPPVITIQTKEALDNYCSFRHVVRNIYSTHLQFKRLEDLAETSPKCLHLVKEELEKFMENLTVLD